MPKRFVWVLLPLLLGMGGPVPAAGHDPAMAAGHADHVRSAEFSEQEALRISQAAIGRELEALTLRDRTGRAVQLSDYRARPLVISLIYTSCYHICPTTTRHLAKVVRNARQALGEQSFRVLTIGFDTPRDTPEAMRVFAQQQGVDDSGWEFLSADAVVMEKLARNLGFIYFSTPKGFDHLIQASVVDANGKIYRQAYGMAFEPPQLVEPLKELVFGQQPGETMLSSVWKKVKLFCTTYDASRDGYRFDYSLFVGMGIGLLIIGAGLAFLVREMLRHRAAPRG
jgi:protein SCO1/2